ncbi:MULTISPECIES: site-specific tyrosine recombinase/integron integrase [Bacillaceae]|uniref:site-specific tyrosine recombinase/integron integrase n=1 Tax=Bacillaceae TaxID=186817 RepID=UPI001BDF6EFB|nr:MULTISPECIES: site-specific tyrosine recombinase/integron integrase [Bacillaceae]MDX8363217.1 tyrosine-type recombinase/integrase [Cytobacillus sp. IB215316]
MLLLEAWERYQSDKKIEGYSTLTIKNYSFQHNLLHRYFGDIEMNKFNTENLKKYLIETGENLKASSLCHRIRYIKSLFNWAFEEGIVYKNPASKLKEPKVGKRIPKFLSEQEIELLRESCHTSMENALFEFMYSTGCRIGEVVKLNRDDINFSSKSVFVMGKGDKEREVYFNVRCDIWLKRYLDEREDDDPALFVTERKPNHRMSIDLMRYIIKRISNRAGIKKNIHPHQLRHSYATHMINNGAPIDLIQSLLGHEKSETTKIYAQLSGKLRHQFYSQYF